MNALAMKPDLILFHARANAQFMLGTHGGKHIIAKMVVPGINVAEEETVDVIFEGTYDDAIGEIMKILQPEGLAPVPDIAEAA